MIDPNNLIPIEEVNSGDYTIIDVPELPICDIKDYDLFDPKDMRKYINDVKRIIRNSFEYRRMVNYLREYMNMNRCSFLENVSNVTDFGIKIHLHHSPFTLEDIVNVVYLKRCELNDSLEIEMLAKEVMYLHYRLAVGLIPLSETVHELVHNSYIFIPVQNVMGNYEMFYNDYGKYMPTEMVDLYERILEFSENYDPNTQNKALQKNYIYYNVEGHNDDFNKVIQEMSDRIDFIKGNSTNLTYEEPKNIEYKKPMIILNGGENK